MKQISVGVVGVGRWGHRVLDEYVTLRDKGHIESVIACDGNPGTLAKATNADERYESVSKTLDEVDAVHVCVANDAHYDVARTALERERDVLLEKPLTLDRNRAYDLVELASEKGVIFQTGHIFRFANVVRQIKDLYQDDYFGDVRYVSMEWTHHLESEECRDVMWDLLPHPIDILNFVTGDWPQIETGISSTYRQVPYPEVAQVHLTVGDIDAHITVSCIDPIRRRDFTIVGSERTIQAECVDQTILVHGDDDSEIVVQPNNTIQSEAKNFVHALTTRKNTFNSAIVGARTVDVIEQVIEGVNP